MLLVAGLIGSYFSHSLWVIIATNGIISGLCLYHSLFYNCVYNKSILTMVLELLKSNVFSQILRYPLTVPNEGHTEKKYLSYFVINGSTLSFCAKTTMY